MCPRVRSTAHRIQSVFLCAATLVACLLLQSCASYSYLAPTLVPASKVAAADHRDRQELVFLVFGDSGVGGTVQANVGRSMQKVCAERSCDFALLLGDNIYNRGVASTGDEKFRTRFEEPYAGLGRLDFWIVPGNHDWRQRASVQSQILYTGQSDRWRMPHNHFAVPSLPDWIHMYGLDTTVIHDLAKERNARRRQPLDESRRQQIGAARAALCGRNGWRLLFGHHPVYSGGDHGRRERPQGLLQAIEEALLAELIHGCDVQVYFAGHEHHQEHIHGPGFEQIIQGAGGRELRPVEALDGPERSQAFGASRHGFGLVTASPHRLVVEFFAIERSAEVARIYETTCEMDSKTIRCRPGPASPAP